MTHGQHVKTLHRPQSPVRQQHNRLQQRQLLVDACDDRQEGEVHQYDLVLAMVGYVGNVAVTEPRVQGVTHGTHAHDAIPVQGTRRVYADGFNW